MLKDLVLRLQQAGPRASLAEPLDWENEVDGQPDDNSWEFDTLRRNTLMALNEGFAADFDDEVQPPSNQATLRATNQSRNLPSSLRLLFEDGSAPPAPPETRRLNLNIPEPAPTSQFSPITPEVAQGEEVLQIPQIPPPSRTRTPLKPFLSTSRNASTSSLEASAHVIIPSMDEPVEEKPPNGRITISVDDNARKVYTPEDEVVTKPLFLNTKLESMAKREDVDLASPASFQFPHPSHITQATQRPSYRGLGLRSPSTRPGTSFSVHQNTHSLDAPSISSKNDYIPSAMPRTRSATTPTPPPISIDPYYERISNVTEIKRPVDLVPSRSTPGLKDVLKIPSLSSGHHMGITDLLPPSPAALTGQRHFPSLSSFLPPSTPNSTLTEEPSMSYDGDGISRRTEQQGKTSFSGPSFASLSPPRPLDYASLIKQRSLSDAELDHTLKSLASWLTAIESGFNSILDNAIEEESDTSFENLIPDEELHSEPTTPL
ncbi:hypothetical protein BDN70DRAFT_525192 [Pholiota conissans]|uniref:Uncharacterized protein n=1 Tax=Pholiota conissans TaxID=109636 RepID=A0A9P5Z7K5_9AGAR|nr:hypothetical protein BDN70DRAFT_525192 [Pholiota conissans]